MVNNFSEYDRISDTLMFFNDFTILEFVVIMSTKDKNGNRISFHSECDYNTNKYSGVDVGHSIKRRMTFYYAINDRRAFNRSFIIRPEDAMTFIMLIESQILPWYFDSKRKIFSFVEGQLKVTGQYQDIYFAKNEYSYLKLQPCVYSFDNGTYKEGIRMYVSNEEVYVDMEIDRFLGLFYFVSRVDMYSVASNMVTYAKMPPYNVNLFSYNGLTGGGQRLQLTNPDNFLPEDPTVVNEEDVKMNNFFNRTATKKSPKKK